MLKYPNYGKLVYCLLQYSQFLSDLDKCCDALVQVLTFVTGRNLYTDTSLSLRNDGIIESSYVYTFLLQGSCIFL